MLTTYHTPPIIKAPVAIGIAAGQVFSQSSELIFFIQDK